MLARLACVLTVAALGAVAVGCGSSSSAKQATATAPAGPGGAGGGRFEALAKCLQSKGVKVPNRRQQPGNGPPPGINLRDPKFQQALEACRTQVFGNNAPQGGPPGGGPPGGAPGAGTQAPGGGSFQ